MHITLDTAQGRVPVAILAIHGDLDASNFEDVIAKARELYNAGTRYLLIDIGNMPFMGSSGVVAIHSVAMLMRGEEPPDPEMGWQAFHTIDHDRDSGAQQHVKLLNPQPKVSRTLQMTGMNEFFEIHSDRQEAIASF
ncbi:MAG TPA: STAS domain-containing protein [Roseiflexaceae bacterium]